MRALLFDQLIPRAALAAKVDEGCVLAHVARESRSIIPKARRIAHQKPPRILEQRLKGIGILAPVVPGKDAAVSDRRFRKTVIHEPVHQIDPVAHPLIRDAARKFFVEPKLAVDLRVERPKGFVEQEFTPVGVLFAN